MGVCGSSMSEEDQKAAARDKQLNADMKKAKAEEDQKIKLLLLGAGESGKTTVFKQMKILYGSNEGITAEEGMLFTPVVYQNVIVSIKILLQEAKNGNFGEDSGKVVPIVATAEADEVSQCADEAIIDPVLGKKIKTLWEDPGVQSIWELRHHFQIVESVKSYFKKLDTIMAADYVASQEDQLLSRVRTSGIVEEAYKIDGVEFQMYDVGGQRNERKKWIHCFENVTSVIFVAAISEYNQTLYEDSQQNRMDEALELFEEIANSKWFVQSSMILFLNKRDLLEEKIWKFPIKGCLGKYQDFPIDGAPTEANHQEYYETAKKYWEDAFRAKNTTNPDKEIYAHCTCATDTGNVKVVFNSCKDVILKGNLQASGFMD